MHNLQYDESPCAFNLYALLVSNKLNPQISVENNGCCTTDFKWIYSKSLVDNILFRCYIKGCEVGLMEKLGPEITSLNRCNIKHINGLTSKHGKKLISCLI